MSKRIREMYEAAWLHYTCGLSKKEIAGQFKVDKATVGRWITAAIAEGLVSITVSPPALDKLEMRLKREFKLRTARVVPAVPWTLGGRERGSQDALIDAQSLEAEAKLAQAEELGKAAAALLEPWLEDGKSTLALGGGTGVAAFSRLLCHHCPTIGMRLFALSVSSREPFNYCATSVTAICTSLLDAEFRRRAARAAPDDSTPAPKVEGYALRLPDRSGDFKTMAAAAAEYYDRAAQEIEIVVTGIGAMETCWILTEKERAKLARDSGARGEILYDFYGERGTPIKVDPTASVFPFSIARLRKLVKDSKEVIVICAGKTRAIWHALSAKRPFVTGIVTDAATAEAVLRFRDRV